MKVYILCGGEGSRCGNPLGDAKCLFKLPTEENVLSRQFRQLKENNINDITVITSLVFPILRQRIRGYCVKYPYVKFQDTTKCLVYPKPEILWAVLPILDESKEETMILLGDVVMDDEVMTEILNEPYEDILYIRREEIKPETFTFLFNEKGLDILKQVPNPFTHYISPKDPTRWWFAKPQHLLWFLEINNRSKVKKLIPEGWISDIDYKKEYEQVCQHLEMKLLRQQ